MEALRKEGEGGPQTAALVMTANHPSAVGTEGWGWCIMLVHL